MDERVVEVEDDDRRRHLPGQGSRVAPNQWPDQYAVDRLETVTPAPSSAAWMNWSLPMKMPLWLTPCAYVFWKKTRSPGLSSLRAGCEPLLYWPISPRDICLPLWRATYHT